MLPKQLRTQALIRLKGYLNPEFTKKYTNVSNLEDDLYGASNLNEALLDHFEFKLEHLLKWEDRNSMWFSLEARVPYLDYRFVEKVLATSADLKIRHGITKFLLRDSMKGKMPENIRMRIDKIGFATPENEWLCTPEWQKIITDILSSSTFKERNLIDSQKILKKYKRHLSGKSNLSKEIWKCIHLELWFRQFID
jgi:asparagine synthase (glutamine-hydrolysing)